MFADGTVGEEGAEFGGMGGDAFAERDEVGGGGLVESGGEHGFAVGFDVKVVAGSVGGLAFGGEEGSEVGFVRGLVFGETDVAIDAEDGLGGVERLEGGVGGGEAMEEVVDGVGEEVLGGEEAIFVAFEPVAVVFLAEVAKEGEDGFHIYLG